MTRSSIRREKSPRPVAGSPKVTKATAAAAPNPFESYDNKKNPFGDDEAEAAGADAGSNPFGEYDDNLNPFARDGDN